VIETTAVADTAQESRTLSTAQTRELARREDTSIEGVVTLVREYAKQETIGPLRGAGQWIGYGAIGALILGAGLALVLLGVLRLIQAEWDRAASGSLSWLAYVIVLVVCVVAIAIAVSRINKPTLTKESD
jgi:hypothetical protein